MELVLCLFSDVVLVDRFVGFLLLYVFRQTDRQRKNYLSSYKSLGTFSTSLGSMPIDLGQLPVLPASGIENTIVNHTHVSERRPRLPQPSSRVDIDHSA